MMTAAATRLRPALHLTASAGWINDPHGVTFHEGSYHLFHQHVPDALDWRPHVRWGHATSTDLLHWQEQPSALLPGDGDVGCWSGAMAVTDDGHGLMFYTAVAEPDLGRGAVRLARPTDETWTSWTKGEVVATAQRDTTVVFRDPVVLRDGDRWRMLVGFGEADGTGGADVFVSDDLDTWTYDGQLATRHTSETEPWTGTAWECPQLLRPGGADVLLVSVWENHVTKYVAAATGAYADGRFEARSWRPLTAGPGHYAASRFVDAEGEESLLFWIRGIADPDGWTGALSVPYRAAVQDGRVLLSPHPAVAAARTHPGGGVPGTVLDVEWSPDRGTRSGRLDLRRADGTSLAEIVARDGELTITVADVADPVVVAHEGPTLRIVVDGPVLEVVADGGLVGLPLRADTDGVLPTTDPASHLAWWHLA